MRNLLRSASVSMLALVAAGCSTTPPKALKPGDTPAAFTAPLTVGEKAAPAWPKPDWWQNLSSPELSALITEAEANNLDLAQAVARVKEAQAQTGIAWSALFPAVDLGASAKREGGVGKTPSEPTFNTFGASLSASYELDFWGLAQDNIRAARYSARSAIYAEEVTALTVTADVADAYLSVLALRERLDIAKKNVAAAKDILSITEAKVKNGVSSNLDLAQQQAQVAQEEAQVPVLEEQEREARYALAILVGRPPEGFDVKATSLSGIVAPPVQPGLPSELLTRRPDIAEAEATLYSAHANVDAARAAFLPQIGLTGQGGYASAAISSLINPSSLAWSAGASLLQAVFDGGQLNSQRHLALAQEEEMVAAYRSTVLNALSDVESALGQVTGFGNQERLTAEEVRAAQEAFRLSELQYREGVAELLTVLQAQQTMFTSEDQLAQVRLARLQAGISLYRALGGGWTVSVDKDKSTRDAFLPL